MKKSLHLCILACCLSIGSAFAETSTGSTSTTAPDKSAVEAALAACASSATKDSSGRPDQQSMESCMSGKGFSRPKAPPGQGDGGQDKPPSAR